MGPGGPKDPLLLVQPGVSVGLEQPKTHGVEERPMMWRISRSLAVEIRSIGLIPSGSRFKRGFPNEPTLLSIRAGRLCWGVSGVRD
jgi:hypothetical protein